MKSLVGLLAYLLQDCGRRSGCPVDRDVKTLRSRAEHEGDSFITITLPTFARDFERCLSLGRVVPGAFLSFGKDRTGIPRFLSGFLHHVFGDDGVLLPTPSIDCIRFVRQICRFGQKLERPCSKERVNKAVDSYRSCDDEIAVPESHLWETFCAVGAVLTAALPQDREDILSSLVPSHGPGATQEHILGNQKYVFQRWHQRLEDVGFTYNRFGRAVPATITDGKPELAEDEVWPVFVEPGAEAPVRVVFVPKTLKTPRVIAVEPVCMQYAQQGISKMLVRFLERNRFSGGHLNFRDQSVNQALAKTASKDCKLATLDMAEASDRVSVAHVEGLLKHNPVLRELVLACRSTSAELPNGDVISLKKFASMGSALCFPLEALVFFTSIIASRVRRAKRPVNARTVYSFSRDVYVYGDDLIVPADEAPAICDDLESLGFKINRHKSFWTGKFRESCGSDCYDNEHVTPVYMRRDLPTSREDVPGLLSAVATCNQLHSAGYWRVAAAFRKAVEQHLGRLPQMPQDSPAIAWWHHSDVLPRTRWNRHLQRVETRLWVTTTPKALDPLEGYPALAKCLRLIGLPPEARDDEHLDRSPRRYSVTLKRSWV